MADLFSDGELAYRAPTEDTFDYPTLHGPIVLDTENHDPRLKTHGSGWAYDRYGPSGGKIIGVAVKCDNFHGYVPIGHAPGLTDGSVNCDPAKVKRWLSHELTKDEKQPKIFANIMYDAGWFHAEGISMSGPLHDVMYQAPLLFEDRLNYSLDSLGKDHLGVGKDERLLAEAAKLLNIKNTKKDNIKAHLMRVHPDIVGVYAMQDVEVTHGLWKKYSPMIQEQSLERVYQLEMDLVPMHIAMRMRGVRVDVEGASRWSGRLNEKQAECRALIKYETGIELGSWDNAEEISKVFDKLEIPYPLTENTKKPSFTSPWMRSLNHPVAAAILDGRKADNMRGTFLQNAILDLEEKGRVHPNFNQLRRDSDDGASGVIGKELKSGIKGAVSGRYSSSTPNFQQVPSPERDDVSGEFLWGHIVRSCFLPEEGEWWHGLDYSSQEPRGILHFAELTNCRGAAKIADRFREDADADFHLENARVLLSKKPDFLNMPAEWDQAAKEKKARKPVKTIGLGIAYGMGGGKLCLQLGLPYTESEWLRPGEETPVKFLKAGPEGVEIMAAFDEAAPYIRELANKCQRRVREKGYIVTPMGRRFRFPRDDSGRLMFLNKALNRLIQGTSADMTKLAMRDLWREGIMPLGTVHDEIDFSSGDPRVIGRAKEIMESALPFNIPIRVDVGSGRNWGDASIPGEQKKHYGFDGGTNYEDFVGGSWTA